MSYFQASGGVLGPYLVGSFSVSKTAETVMQLINPTSSTLVAMIALFGVNGALVAPGRKQTVPPNGMVEVILRAMEPKAQLGVIKVVTMDADGKMPTPGLVGYQRKAINNGDFSETILQPVPVEILKADLSRILAAFA